MRFFMRCFVLTSLAILAGASVRAETPSGEAVYKQRCAACHEANNPRIPPRATLQKLPATSILRTLNYGAMITVAYTMSIAEREAVAKYLGVAGGEPVTSPNAFCKDRTVKLDGQSKNSMEWMESRRVELALSKQQRRGTFHRSGETFKTEMGVCV